MADVKITDFNALTTPALADILEVVDDVGGTPTNKKIEIGYLLGLPMAQIYTTSGAGTQTPGASYVKLTQWTANGPSYLATADQANDKITLSETGLYKVEFQATLTSDTASHEVSFRAYWNAVAQTQCTCKGETGTAGEALSISFVGMVDVTSASTDLEVYVLSDNAAATVVIEEAQLVATRIAPT